MMSASGWGVVGCGGAFNQHAQMMDAMRGVMKDAASRLGESGNGQIAAGGHVVNPGIRVSGGVEYFAIARYEGVGGQVQASMAGPLDRPVAPEVQAAADAIWRDASKSAEQKLNLLRALIQGRDSIQQSKLKSAGAGELVDE